MAQNAELLALREQCARLQQRCAMLQSHVDAMGEKMVKMVVEGIHDAGSADGALTMHDASWFAALPYSPDVRRRIATRLLDAITPYPFLDADYLRVVARTGE